MSLIIKTIYPRNQNLKNINNLKRSFISLSWLSKSSSKATATEIGRGRRYLSVSSRNKLLAKNEQHQNIFSLQRLLYTNQQSSLLNKTNNTFFSNQSTLKFINQSITSLSSTLFTYQQIRGAKMWIPAPKRKKLDQDKDKMGPLLECLRLAKATTIINQIKKPVRKEVSNLEDISLKFKLQPILKKSVNSNIMRGRLFLPNQLPKLKSAEEDEELIAIIWPIETLIKDFNKDQKKTEHQIYLNDLSESLGVDHIGGKELIDQIIEGKINPTKLLCHPDLLPLLIKDSRVAKVLGPRGLIPSEKRGTVSTDLNRLVQDAKGSLDWVMDPNSGLVIAELGKLSMDLQAIEQNLMVLVDTVGDLAQGGQGVSRTFKSGRPIKQPGIKKVVLEAPGLPEIIVT